MKLEDRGVRQPSPSAYDRNMAHIKASGGLRKCVICGGELPFRKNQTLTRYMTVRAHNGECSANLGAISRAAQAARARKAKDGQPNNNEKACWNAVFRAMANSRVLIENQ